MTSVSIDYHMTDRAPVRARRLNDRVVTVDLCDDDGLRVITLYVDTARQALALLRAVLTAADLFVPTHDDDVRLASEADPDPQAALA